MFFSFNWISIFYLLVSVNQITTYNLVFFLFYKKDDVLFEIF